MSPEDKTVKLKVVIHALLTFITGGAWLIVLLIWFMLKVASKK